MTELKGTREVILAFSLGEDVYIYKMKWEVYVEDSHHKHIKPRAAA